MTIQKIQNLSDEQLVTEFQTTGDNRFFGEIYNRYYKKVFHTSLGIVKDRDVAYDLVQDVMIKVMENLPGLKNSFLLGLWIHRIAKNHSIDYCKNRQNLSLLQTDKQFDMTDEVMEVETLIAKDNLLDGVEKAMKELKEEDRSILILKYFENYSVEDLQSKCSISKSAVKMRLARARQRMVSLYQKEQLEVLYA